ncbi:MAG: hypothetical protein HY400_05095 [Elusimicrobia bacterium]|nr:hypothetical protein [Elusimicrobiota bacterium]
MWHDFIYLSSQHPIRLLHGLGVGLGLFSLLTFGHSLLQKHRLELEKELRRTLFTLEETDMALQTAEYINRLKERDIQKIKTALVTQAKTQKKFHEEKFILTEEKRQLEKQWDLLITYLMLEATESQPEANKLHIMKGDQATKSFRVAPLVCWGDPALKIPKLSTVTSKERFAHPERGRVEFKDGQLHWIPPQIGPALRSLALGENVIFTNGPLILHGPAKDSQQHEAYPHCCLPMTAATATQVYGTVYIGTRILIQNGTP